MKTYWGVEAQLHASAALPPGKSSQYALNRRLGGPQGRSGYCGEEKNSSCPCYESNHGRAARSCHYTD
jgi:hypothetical protein